MAAVSAYLEILRKCDSMIERPVDQSTGNVFLDSEALRKRVAIYLSRLARAACHA